MRRYLILAIIALLKNIHYIRLETVDSTNTWAKAYASQLTEPFTCITAHEQTAGHGRFNRPWASPPGQNIYATLVFQVPNPCTYLCNIGQVMALSCAQLLREKGLAAELKWPNDILINGKKISGVLTETVPLENTTAVILGVGLNVNMESALLQALDQPATSLLQLTGKMWSLPELLQELLEKFLTHLELLQTSGFAAFKKPFELLLVHLGKEITCQGGLHSYKGLCQGITDQGHLQLLLPSGEIKMIPSGELNL